jgi:hypothetical protein
MHIFIYPYVFIWTSRCLLSLLICVYFCAHYRCLFGWVYVVYVGHIYEVDRNPFPCCNYLSKHHHYYIHSCPQCSAPRKRYAKKVGDKWGVTNDGEYIIYVYSVYIHICLYMQLYALRLVYVDIHIFIYTYIASFILWHSHICRSKCLCVWVCRYVYIYPHKCNVQLHKLMCTWIFQYLGGDTPIYFLTFVGLAATVWFSLVVVPTL